MFASAGGGGLFISGGTAEWCTIVKNYSYLHGGGAWVDGGSLLNSRVLSNYVSTAETASGGGVYLKSGLVRNCLVADNGAAATVYGGGVCVQNGLLDFCTIARNAANTAGGGVKRNGGDVMNSIICFNTAPSDSDVSGAEGFAYCLSPDLTGDSGNNLCVAADFKDLANNDFSHRNAGSPGVNAALWDDWVKNAVDLNGESRCFGRAPDMGAYECRGVAGAMLKVR